MRRQDTARMRRTCAVRKKNRGRRIKGLETPPLDGGVGGWSKILVTHVLSICFYGFEYSCFPNFTGNFTCRKWHKSGLLSVNHDGQKIRAVPGTLCSKSPKIQYSVN